MAKIYEYVEVEIALNKIKSYILICINELNYYTELLNSCSKTNDLTALYHSMNIYIYS